MAVVENLLQGLDEEQKKAVTLETNAVVAAGAGSGKTKVLASRYVYLVIEKKLKPEEILTLTFTNKAVSEMYSRIYRYLLEQAGSEVSDPKSPGPISTGQRAVDALKNFHKARISTLDSFSASVARTAAARYGISPDFSSDDNRLRDLAREAALVFVLDHREAPAIRRLLVDHKIRILAEEIFARFVLEFSPVSSPLNLDECLLVQKEIILKKWKEKVRLLKEITGNIIDALHRLAVRKESIGFTEALGEILFTASPPCLEDINPFLDEELPLFNARRQIKEYFDYYSALIDIHLPGNYRDVFKAAVENFKLLKGKDGDGLYFELEALANYAFNFDLCEGIFGLLKKFQDEFHIKKRETGFLSFNDIAHLAVDALKDHPDIRKVYKDTYKMIMIDEFQDNNALQRDLIYLLSENPERNKKGIAVPEELEKDRMFFVGDEKQSIYRFRGADVAVFRSLSRTIGPDGNITLLHNYRSRPGLIAAFNYIFQRLFLRPGPGVSDFEAEYHNIFPGGKTVPDYGSKGNDPYDSINDPYGQGPLAYFCFVNGDELPKNETEGIKSQDLEAVFIAKKIRDMVDGKEMILKRTDEGTEWIKCSWGDFAVLERSYTHQGTLEKQFRKFGIPYNTDRPSGLFSDAPILDLRAYLRLLVYPEDRIAYAALIRSPFMRLSDLTLAVCMLAYNKPGESREPFGEENESLIPEEERPLYRQARERYNALREIKGRVSLTELITKLWFDEGYRYETLWNESVQVYESLFDLFFNLACEAESRGKNLAEFIDYLDEVMNREIKPDDKDIPGEGESGVRIMSIHKSKGLEFPVLFIYDCSHSGNIRTTSELIRFNERFGLILKIPQAEELTLGGNYFWDIMTEEEKAKDNAELKRLLYVAMTRAENRLFLTFTLPAQTKKEKEEWEIEGMEFTEEIIRLRLAQLGKKDGRETFLKLLTPILPHCPPSLCSLEVIPVLSRAEISKLARSASAHAATVYSGISSEAAILNQKEAALAAVPFYENAEIIREGKAGPVSIEASKLRYKPKDLEIAARPVFGGEKVPLSAGGTDTSAAALGDNLDMLLEKAGLEHKDFGSLVHAVLEARLRGRLNIIPPRIHSRVTEEKTLEKLLVFAESMANAFLASDLGKRWTASDHREIEFPVITSTESSKTTAIMGQMDLLFEEDDEAVVVDFKTDRIENPEDHLGQLAAYYQAAGDIFSKPVSVWLYYLRSGRSVDLTNEVKGLSLDALVLANLAEEAG